jgi:hypothetical protein
MSEHYRIALERVWIPPGFKGAGKDHRQLELDWLTVLSDMLPEMLRGVLDML